MAAAGVLSQHLTGPGYFQSLGQAVMALLFRHLVYSLKATVQHTETSHDTLFAVVGQQRTGEFWKKRGND